ncbi:hypothetical protein A45J_2675 [hot springs metagenome]|uniref:Uncharacterized protein n=1 Tax=hot springs metagenome TaxID=433727 RepID=A0A5J4KZ41_9ZZZZ
MLQNTKGSIHISTIIFIFALIGLWFIYRSYQENKLKDNLSVVINDYKSIVLAVIKDPKQKQQVEQLFSKIQANADGNANIYIEQIKRIAMQYGNSAEIQKQLEHLKKAINVNADKH